MSKDCFPYLHGFSKEEQQRLREQARFAEFQVFRDIDFSSCENVLEVGCGVGAQSEILLRRFPDIQLKGIDANEKQLDAAKKWLGQQSSFTGRYDLEKMNAESLSLPSNSMDGAFVCWILEHVSDPQRVLSEVRRVVKPGGRVYVTEVMNSSFFLDPYSPNVWKYWMAFNDYQYDGAGDPFIGAKLGNLLMGVGFQRVKTSIKTWHFDNRQPEKRQEIIEFWSELLLSAADQLIKAKYVDQETVDNMETELKQVSINPNAVFMDSFMQAEAYVY